MQKIYRISTYRLLITQLIGYFVFSCIAVYITWSLNGYPVYLWLTLALLALYLLPQLTILAYLLSYRLVITSNGQIYESQLFHKTRQLPLDKVSGIKWSYYGGLPTGWGGIILRRLRVKITEIFLRSPSFQGALVTYGWGPEITNPLHQIFPKYGVDPGLARDLAELKPSIPADPAVWQNQINAQTLRSHLNRIIWPVFGVVYIILAIAWKLDWIFVLPGFVMILLGWYTSKK